MVYRYQHTRAARESQVGLFEAENRSAFKLIEITILAVVLK